MVGSRRTFSISLRAALPALLAVALLMGVIPAGFVLDRWLQQEIEARAWRDVALAPAILADRNRTTADAVMMHAKDVAHAPPLVAAMAAGDHARAAIAADDAARSLKHSAILIDRAGTQWRGPPIPHDVVQATTRGQMPVLTVSDSTGLYLVSVAPIEHERAWLGAAGVASLLDEAAAGALAALTRSDLVILLPGDSTRSVFSAALPAAVGIEEALRQPAGGPAVRALTIQNRPYLIATGELAGSTVGFVRDLRRDMSILPRLRQVLLASGAAALLVALLLGSQLALTLLRPVRVLAAAADRLSRGDFMAPLPASRVRDFERVSSAFGTMRDALGSRLEELRDANRMLEERQTRLATLQAELIRRERVAASGRMATELAHEIRNPIANLRNCLEVLYRRLQEDPAQEFASLAIDELLRMHELAERMLDLNRPHKPGIRDADVVARAGGGRSHPAGCRRSRHRCACARRRSRTRRDPAGGAQAGDAQSGAERARCEAARSAHCRRRHWRRCRRDHRRD